MAARPVRGVVGAAAVLLLLCWSGAAEAHPNLAGTWSAPVPPGGLMTFDFACGHYVGAGVWKGPFTSSVSGCLSGGVYELRLMTATEGTLGIRDGNGIATKVGTVDLATGTVTFLNTIFKR